MQYTINNIEKIVKFKTWSDKKKISELLQIDCWMYCNLGTDSTKQQRLDVRKNSRKIYINIKKIDPSLGNMFLNSLDRIE
jgi:hypothetical protein